MTHVLSIDRLDVDLKGRAVLRAVSITIRAGGLVALIGPNGAGKSTLLKSIAGLLTPTAGRITFDATDLAACNATTRARTLAYLPQDRHVAWPMRAGDIVALGRRPVHRLYDNATDADRAAIAIAMQTMDVTRFADRPILQLSGGERARVLMARALAQQTPMLIADEPAAGLDPAHQWHLFETLAGLARSGRIVVVALHDLSFAARFADHVILMRAGQIAADGPPTEVLTSARLAEVYGITATSRVNDGVLQIVQTGVAPRTPS